MRIRWLRGRRLWAAAVGVVVATGLAVTLATTGSSAARVQATNAALAVPNSATVTRCLSQNLEVWIGIGGGEATAGSTFYPLEFTNLTSHTCYLRGYPGVSTLKAGRQQGNAAGRTASTVSTVYLAPGATAHATLQVTNVGDFPASACKPVQADTIRVYAPGAYDPDYVPYGLRACSASGPSAPVYLQVRAVTAGTGVPGRA